MNRGTQPGTDNWRLIGGGCGVLFIVLFVIGILMQGDMPNWDDNPADIRSFFADNGTRYAVSDWLISLAFVFGWLPFIVVMKKAFDPVDPSGGVWSTVGLIAGLSFMLAGLASSGANGALAVTEGDGLDDSVLRFAMAAGDYGFSLGFVTLASFGLANGLLALRTGAVWRWAGVLGLAGALCAALAPLQETAHNSDNAWGIFFLVGGLASALFVLAVSVALVRQGLREGVQRSAAAAPA